MHRIKKKLYCCLPQVFGSRLSGFFLMPQEHIADDVRFITKIIEIYPKIKEYSRKIDIIKIGKYTKKHRSKLLFTKPIRRYFVGTAVFI